VNAEVACAGGFTTFEAPIVPPICTVLTEALRCSVQPGPASAAVIAVPAIAAGLTGPVVAVITPGLLEHDATHTSVTNTARIGLRTIKRE
jgi:hypothetical protein